MRPTWFVLLLALPGLATGGCERPPEFRSAALVEMLSPESIRQANHGRELLRADGFLAIPEGVTRVWVDVGAHHLETTLPPMQKNPDLALIAIEPLSEAWASWPDDPRILGIPAALDRARGVRDFHVNRSDSTSSLLATDPGESVIPLTDIAAATVEVRKVPVLLLADVLERIPPGIDIELVKTDVQGVDLQVLKSAGDELRRAWRVKTEVIVHNEGVYRAEGEDTPGSEQEFTDYMQSVGFEFVADRNVAPQRMWLDKEYVNADLAREDARVRQRSADLEWSLEQ